MAEQAYKVAVKLPYQSGLPEDVAINDFYFTNDDPGTTQAADIAAIVTRLTNFYTVTPSGGSIAIGKLLGIQVDHGANKAKFLTYVGDGPSTPPADWGTPVSTNSWTVPAIVTASGLPAEAAVCLSFHADLTDIPETEVNPDPPPAIIRPAAHRRGRIYFGPCYAGLISNEGANQDARITSSRRTDFAKAMLALFTANTSLQWVVQSKTAGEFFPVVGGYVDDAFDTQRRRGSAPGVRTVW